MGSVTHPACHVACVLDWQRLPCWIISRGRAPGQWLRRATQPERRFWKSGAMSSEYSLAFGEDWAETLTVGNLAWPQKANRRAILPRALSTDVWVLGNSRPMMAGLWLSIEEPALEFLVCLALIAPSWTPGFLARLLGHMYPSLTSNCVAKNDLERLILLPLPLKGWDYWCYSTTLGLLRTRGFNPGLWICKASTLPTQPYSEPRPRFWHQKSPLHFSSRRKTCYHKPPKAGPGSGACSGWFYWELRQRMQFTPVPGQSSGVC